jgi:23S rRNA (pseudouridine1915-N3)-methyltransferase
VRLKVVCIGRTQKGYLTQGIKDYITRLQHYIKLEWIELQKSKKSRSSKYHEGLKKESEKIWAHIHSSALWVVLAEGGKAFSSSDFAKWIESRMIEGRQEIIFIIGGDQGLDPEILSKADLKLSLSRMTFTHQMIRLIFLEQLYRAFTIIRGEPYHHG